MESDEDYFLRVTATRRARRLRISVVPTNDQVLGFWHRMGFTETGEVRPWRYDKLESESILMDKLLP
jgi:ribosomal protein S18 acetylase RimI-like enzyme